MDKLVDKLIEEAPKKKASRTHLNKINMRCQEEKIQTDELNTFQEQDKIVSFTSTKQDNDLKKVSGSDNIVFSEREKNLEREAYEEITAQMLAGRVFTSEEMSNFYDEFYKEHGEL